MNIALVFPHYSHRHRRFEEDIDVVGREFGLMPPLGLAYAAAIMEQSGHTVIIIDANALRFSEEKTVKILREFNPDLIGFMLTVWTFQLTLSWIKYIKRHLNAPILVGNIQLQLYPEETFSHKEIDYGIIGSAQHSLPKLLSALEKNGSLEDIEGIVFRKNGKVVIHYPGSFYEDFNTLPFPARHLLPNQCYREVMSKRKNFTILMTSKGCPGKCSFCHIQNTPYSCRSPVGVADEIEQCYRKYNIREIDIFDPSFTIDRQRIIEICREIQNRKLDIHFSCRARIDQVDEELLAIMARTGFKKILYGIESGDQRILDTIKKGITIAQIQRAIVMTKAKGMKALGFFLIGAPEDTVESVKKTIRFAEQLKVDYAQFHKVMAKPCTELYEQVKVIMKRDYWREFVLGVAGEERLPSPWTGLTEKQIEDFTIRAYRSFYFRPGYLIDTLCNIKSFDEFARYARSAIGLMTVKSDVCFPVKG
ncbi:MAG: cobalamin-dependent protein [Candidatus Omnitrophica bacterium]|nr:cobalamin-dependent protein [Candidatus Omnitrophota bacterium]